MRRIGSTLTTALLLAIGTAAAATAQEASMPVEPDDAADRAYVRSVLDRDEVRTAARIADVDLEAAAAAVDGLEGERLDRAVDQARTLDRALGDAQDDRISIRVTTLIILLLILIIILIAA